MKIREDLFILKQILNGFGWLAKKTYKYEDETYPNWKYVYFFFYQRLLFFNFHVPWPCHPTSTITSPSRIKFGNKTSPGSGPNQYIQGENGIVLGNNVQIGPSVSIISANHDLSDFDIHITSDPIVIGNNVWIGCYSVILPSVIIGNNVAIGAGSIVTKSIPDNSIAFGNPCKVIKGKNPYKKENEQ
jgi:acetyltransferase-like isoleucine patch superfamily enzyme